MSSTERKDSEAIEIYWLQTVMEDRAESAPPPAHLQPTDAEDAKE